MVAVLLLTVAATVATFAILTVLHASDPAHHKLVGGLRHFDDGMYSLTQLTTVAAILVGATAGAGDLAAGFFRSLVVTGRTRWALYATRVPGGLFVLLPLSGLAYTITALACQFAHGSQSTPSASLLIALGLGGWRTITRDA
jgi:ABC-type transport system involved in multi-copper enzyme maturation permease subunit